MLNPEILGCEPVAPLIVVRYVLSLLARGLTPYFLWPETAPGHSETVMRFVVPSDLMALKEILAWLSQAVSPHLAPEQFWQIQLLIVEGFTNTVKYAHKQLPLPTPIEIRLYPSPHSIEIHIWDFGHPFDLQAELKNRLSHSNPYREDKQGLLLMSKTADGLDYFRVGDRRNCLIIRKILCWRTE